MLDPKLLRQELSSVAEALLTRGFTLDQEKINRLETERRNWQVLVEKLRQERNDHAKKVGQMKARGEDIAPELAAVESLGSKLANAESALNTIQEELQTYVAHIPNIPHSSVPIGASELDNQEVRRWGDIPQFSFTPKDHADLGGKNLDFNAGAILTGARFVVMKDKIARLHRALGQYMLNTHIDRHGYTEVNVPYIVNRDSLFCTGQLPNLEDDTFFLASENWGLIPTAEVPVTNLARDSRFEPEELPQKYVCYSACFRKEAGSYGKDTRGMIRQHQFEKVELVHFVRPEDSYAALETLLSHAESILQDLQLPYRVVSLCTGDLGFGSAKTYDLEVWLPGQNKYREISSCSNFEAFQARRLKARWRNPQSGELELIHTLNGSGLAIGRTLVAVLENYQEADGRIRVPAVLQPYMKAELL